MKFQKIVTSRVLASACAFALALAIAPTTGHAAGPQMRTQAPGYYRIMLGEFEVTALSDGTVPQAMDKLLLNIKAGEVESLAALNFQTLPLETSINGFLINTGSKLILVDTGSGELFGPKAGGRLITNLKAAGYEPGQIDAVLLTHLHGDHSGGLVIGGKVAFPNAQIFLDQTDRDFRFNAEEEAKAPANQKRFFSQSRASLEPYIAADKVRTFKGPTELFPGITTIAAPGHTPGHTLYAVESKRQKLVLWGDTVHTADMQLPRPAVTIQYDADSDAAAAQRARTLSDFSKNRTLIGAAHISFPGLGYLRTEGAGYTWVPVTYSLRGMTGQ